MTLNNLPNLPDTDAEEVLLTEGSGHPRNDARRAFADLAMRKAHNESALLMAILQFEKEYDADALIDFELEFTHSLHLWEKHHNQRLDGYLVACRQIFAHLRDLRRLAHAIRDTGTTGVDGATEVGQEGD